MAIKFQSVSSRVEVCSEFACLARSQVGLFSRRRRRHEHDDAANFVLVTKHGSGSSDLPTQTLSSETIYHTNTEL